MKIYIFDSDGRFDIIDGKKRDLKNRPKPVIMLMGGIHGNEPSGSFMLSKFINELLVNEHNINNGTLVILPRVNEPGLNSYARRLPFTFHGDINRNFIINEESGFSKTRGWHANIISDYTRQSDFIIDYHEGVDYHTRNKRSIGSTLTSNKFSLSDALGKDTVDRINNVSINMPKYKKWQHLKNRCNRRGTHRCFASSLRKPYLLVETTGQKEIQPLWLRVFQCRTILENILHKLNVINFPEKKYIDYSLFNHS